MNFIVSSCRIVPGCVWLNREVYFESTREPFDMNSFFSSVYEHIGIDYRRFYKMDALSKLGFLASEILLAGSDREQPKPDTGIILFNKNSSLEADMNYQKTIQHKDDFFPSPTEFVYTLPNIVAGEIAIRNKIYGETAFYVLRRFYSDTINDVIDDALHVGRIKCALGGWINVDIPKNAVDGFMMLCASMPLKFANNGFTPCLPAGLKGVRTGNIDFLTYSDIIDLYRNFKI